MGQFRANSAKCDSGRALRGEEHKVRQWNVDSIMPWSFLSYPRFEAHPKRTLMMLPWHALTSSRPLQRWRKHQALCFALQHEWLCCRTAWYRRRSLDRCKKLVPSHPREGWVSVGRCIASFHLHLNRFQEHGQDDRSLKIGMQRGECKICDVFHFKFLWFSCIYSRSDS